MLVNVAAIKSIYGKLDSGRCIVNLRESGEEYKVDVSAAKMALEICRSATERKYVKIKEI
jgi:hypothetical protein